MAIDLATGVVRRVTGLNNEVRSIAGCAGKLVGVTQDEILVIDPDSAAIVTRQAAPSSGPLNLVALPDRVEGTRELGAVELYWALASGAAPSGLAHADPMHYLRLAAHWADAYIHGPNDAADTLNLYRQDERRYDAKITIPLRRSARA